LAVCDDEFAVRRFFLALLVLLPMGAWSAGQQPPDGPLPQADAVPLATARGTLSIVLDPGHGGADNGVVGPGGLNEKTLTLDIARRVKALIESRLGARVLLTRDDDSDVTLDARAASANAARADLFVSLHFNAALSPQASGAEVYLLAPGPESAEGDGEAAAPSSLVLPQARGGSRTVTFLPWARAQARHREASVLAANLLMASLRERVPLGARPLSEAPMRLLASLDMPAVHVELAYLTNPEQAEAAPSEPFQAEVADALVGAIAGYRATSGGAGAGSGLGGARQP
jgi:N-acetylmuramoyl-L-alanine amidase